MSTQSAKAYIKRMKTDKAFAGRINGCKTAEERLKLAKASGFDFTAAELMAEKDNLSDTDLDRVAGGGPPNVCKKPSEKVVI